MLLIVMNCVTLAIYDPFDPRCLTQQCQTLAWFEFSFNVFFTIEAVCKITAMGFFGHGSYLADRWNILDFIIVVFGLVDLVPGPELPGVNLLRMARVLRPLRAVNRVPGLRILISLILETLPMLGNVVMLCLLLFVVFSILGVQLLQGVMHNRCYDANGTSYYQQDEAIAYICTIAPDAGMLQCSPGDAYPNFYFKPGPQFTDCRADGPNPDAGMISFDNIFLAFVTIFLVFTMEGWTEVVYKAQDAYSFWIWIYFYTVAVVGGIIAINLFLVVITAQFCATKEADRDQQEAERVKRLTENPDGIPEEESPFDAAFRYLTCSTGTTTEKVEPTHLDVETQLGEGSHGADEANSKEAPHQWAKPRDPVMIDSVTKEDTLTSADKQADLQTEVLPAFGTTGFVATSSDGSGTGQANGSIVDAVADKHSVVVPEETPKESKPTTTGHSAAEEAEDGKQYSKPSILMTRKELSIVFKRYADIAESIREEELKGLAPRYRLKKLVQAEFFSNFIMLVIVLNTMTMASEHHGQPALLEDVQFALNYIFTFIFLLEMLLKLVGLGFNEYAKDSMNLFDGIIVIASLTELGMGGGGILSVLRTFRLMRIFKIVRFFPGLQRQMVVIVASVGQMGNFTLILLLYMFIYGILGMYLFGAKLQHRSHFNNLYRSMLTVFQMITIEDWPGVMYDAVSATTEAASLYFLSLIVGGNFVLCNLFVAILLEGFAERASKDEKSIRLAFENDRLKRFKTRVRNAFTAGSIRYMFQFWKEYTLKCVEHGGWEMLEAAEQQGAEGLRLDNDNNNNGMTTSRSPSGGSFSPSGMTMTPVPPSFPPPANGVTRGQLGSSHITLGAIVEPAHDTDPESDDESEPEVAAQEADDPCTYGNSLMVFSATNPVRVACAQLVSSKVCDQTILFFIGLNSCAMAIERPSIEDDSVERRFLDILGYIFTIVFLVELVAKVIAWGLVLGPNAYLKDAWNKLDGFLVTVSLIDVLLLITNVDAGQFIGMLRILRLLRALRPLRVINRAPKLKRVVQTLVDSLGSIGNTIIISSVFFLIFGILSVQLWSGKLYYCSVTEGTYNNETIPVIDKQDCAKVGGDWKNQTYNYDNLLQALLTLFYVSSFDGWVDVMFYTMDAKGVDQQPEKDHNEACAIFFVVFLLIANFFILNMFVGVIVESFQMASDPDEAKKMIISKLREEKKLQKQQESYDHCLKMYRFAHGPTMKLVVRFVESDIFDNFITSVIMLNMISMGVEHHGQSATMGKVLEYCNYIFTTIFAIEAALKVQAFGVTCYFGDAWNKFDFFIVIMSFVGIFIEEVYGDSAALNPALIRVMRVFRIARILKLLKSAKTLAALIETTIKSLTQVASVCLLLMLIFFIYAAAGVALFGRLACTKTNPCVGLSIHANFENFGMAMITLFRICTGDNGNGLLKDALRESPDCNESPDCEYNCCADQFLSPLFFLSFTVVAQFVLLNVVVAVLMSELENSQQEQEALDAAEQAEANAAATKELAETMATEQLIARQAELKSAGCATADR